MSFSTPNWDMALSITLLLLRETYTELRIYMPISLSTGSAVAMDAMVRRVVSGTAVVSGGAVSVVSATGASVAEVGSGTGSGVRVTITGCSLVCTGGSVSGSVSGCVWTGAAVVSVGSGASVAVGSVTHGSSGGGPQGLQGS